jgi:Core-2/I-Branching enzyme
MAVAYLIRTHHRPEQLVRLVERLTTPEASFFVHVDRRAPDFVYEAMRTGLAGRKNVYWVPRVDSYYSGFSFVRSILAGLEEVRSTGTQSHTVLLSGQCYPLRPAAQIESFLAERAGESLVEHFRIPSERWADEDGGLDRIRYRHYERVRFRTRTLRLPLLRRSFPNGLEPWGGSAWCVLSADAVETLLAFRDERPDAYHFFDRVRAPEEIFLQTVLLNSPLRDRVANEGVHHIEWPGGSHPRTFTSGDFDRLAASGKPFARKFDVARDEKILDVIDRELLGEG